MRKKVKDQPTPSSGSIDLFSKLEKVEGQYPGILISTFSPRIYFECLRILTLYGLCDISDSIKQVTRQKDTGFSRYYCEFKLYDYRVTLDMDQGSGIIISSESRKLRDELLNQLRQKLYKKHDSLVFHSEKIHKTPLN